MKHADALKKIIPLDLGAVSNKDIEIEGAQLDTAADQIMQLIKEIYPSTTDALLSMWEVEYGITPEPGDSVEVRRRNLLAKHMDANNLSRSRLIAMAAALGHNIQITEGGEAYPMFRVGDSKVGDRLYEPRLMWVWTVITIGSQPDAALISLFNDIKPPHTSVTFESAG